MLINFSKISATGNDFILIDNRSQSFKLSSEQIARCCERHIGIGADGLIFLELTSGDRYKMRYFNADGLEAEMCGNGARAITLFAATKGLLPQREQTYFFETMKGGFQSQFTHSDGVKIKMDKISEFDAISLDKFSFSSKKIYLNTGVPHVVFEVPNLRDYSVVEMGRSIRHDEIFPKGVNVNFFEVIGPQQVRVRTFERGVEDETRACGTGAVAVALAMNHFYSWQKQVEVIMAGGILTVSFDTKWENIYLCGKVEKIFDGEINLG